MKKYWKITNSDVRIKLESLNFDKNLIKVYLNETSIFMFELKKHQYVFVSYNDVDIIKFGWNGINETFYIENGYKYCGEVLLRKEKIKKLLKK